MKSLIPLFMFLVLSASAGFSGVPTRINYQGRLLDAQGNPFTGSAMMQFTLYPPGPAVTPLYSQANLVNIVDGLYSVALGSDQPSFVDALTNDTVFLEIVVNNTVLSPRQELLSVPYAIVAGTSHRVEGEVILDSVSEASPAAGTLQWSGSDFLGYDGTEWVSLTRDASEADPIQGWHLSANRRVVVALIDSGIDFSHPDLAGRFWVNPGEIPGNGVDDDNNGFVDDVHGYDFVDDDGDPEDFCYGHGTSTAGVLGALRNNGIGIEGAADHVEFMVLRVLSCGGTSTEQRLVDAIEYANSNGAQLIQAVVFISQAWGIPCWKQPDCVPNLCSAIENSEILIVSVAGNEGIDIDSTFRYPPSCPSSNQIVVTASDMSDTVVGSTGALTVDIAAPGVDIWTTTQAAGNSLWSGDPTGYMQVSGSSYATPQVVAVAVRLLQLDPDLDAATLRERVLSNTRNGILSAFYE